MAWQILTHDTTGQGPRSSNPGPGLPCLSNSLIGNRDKTSAMRLMPWTRRPRGSKPAFCWFLMAALLVHPPAPPVNPRACLAATPAGCLLSTVRLVLVASVHGLDSQLLAAARDAIGHHGRLSSCCKAPSSSAHLPTLSIQPASPGLYNRRGDYSRRAQKRQAQASMNTRRLDAVAPPAN